MSSIHTKALERASQLKGGPEELAKHLGIPLSSMMLILQGKATLSPSHFDSIVDLLLQADLRSLNDPLVLVVEDDRATAYSFSKSIQQLGYRVDNATDGRMALEYIRSRQPAVAFVDLRLPDMTGWELAEAVKREGLTTKIYALTAHSDMDMRDRSLAAGFEAHFSKPMDAEALEKLVPRRKKP